MNEVTVKACCVIEHFMRLQVSSTQGTENWWGLYRKLIHQMISLVQSHPSDDLTRRAFDLMCEAIGLDNEGSDKWWDSFRAMRPKAQAILIEATIKGVGDYTEITPGDIISKMDCVESPSGKNS